MDETKQAQGGSHFLVHISPLQGWGVGVILLKKWASPIGLHISPFQGFPSPERAIYHCIGWSPMQFLVHISPLQGWGVGVILF